MGSERCIDAPLSETLGSTKGQRKHCRHFTPFLQCELQQASLRPNGAHSAGRGGTPLQKHEITVLRLRLKNAQAQRSYWQHV